jgi:hypothetical protein
MVRVEAGEVTVEAVNCELKKVLEMVAKVNLVPVDDN